MNSLRTERLIFITDENGLLLYVNELAARLTSINPINKGNLCFSALFTNTAHANLLLHEAVTEKVTRDIELSIANSLLPNNPVYHFTAYTITDAAGRVNILIISSHKEDDISNKEPSLKKIKREISDYKYALDESSIVAITDQKGVIKYVNANFCYISKYTKEELVGQDHRIINSGHHPKDFIRNLWVTIANGSIWRGELKNKAKDGSFYWVDTTIVPFLDEEKKPYQYLAIRADITQRKKAEEEILVLNEELEKRVKERTEEMESFSYSVSHDLRAPLRAVNGYANILEDDYQNILDSEGKRLLNEIQKNAKKMGMLIDDLLAFSRLGRKEIERAAVDMTKLAASAINEVNQSNPHHAEIKLSPLHPAMADSSLLQNVLINLISNAVKYSSKNEQALIEIKSESNDEEHIYSVSDNGVGFDMEYLGKLFGVFQRLHSPEEFPGTGVGLAIAKRIIKKHNGHIWAEGTINKGATFFFSLPKVNN